jgi:hypothetical protein
LCSNSAAIPSSVTFPDPGKSVTWQCSAQYASTSCVAIHQKNPDPDYTWNGNVHNSAWGNMLGWLVFGLPSINSPYYGRYIGVTTTPAANGTYTISGKAYSRDFGLVDFSGTSAIPSSTSGYLVLSGNAKFVSIADNLVLSKGTVTCSKDEPVPSDTNNFGVCLDNTDGSPTKGMAFGYAWSEVYGFIKFNGNEYADPIHDASKSFNYQMTTEIGSTIPTCSDFDPASPTIRQSGLVVGWIETCGPSFGNFIAQRLTSVDPKNQCTIGSLQRGHDGQHGGMMSGGGSSGGGMSGTNSWWPGGSGEFFWGQGMPGTSSWWQGGMNMANGDSGNANYNINCNGDPIANVLSSVGVPVISANNAPYARENIKQRLINLVCLAGKTGADVGTILTNFKLTTAPFNINTNDPGLTSCTGTGTNNNTNGSNWGYTCYNFKCVKIEGGDNTLCNIDTPQNFFTCDILPPGFSVSPQSGNYDSTTITSSPAIILKATDKESGLKQVNYKWSLNNPDTTGVVSSPDGILYPTGSNYAFQTSLPMKTTEGTWYLNMYVLDNAGNHAGPVAAGHYNITGTSTHKACNGSLTAPACTVVAGTGPDTCSKDSDCILPSHRECQGSSCTVVAGAGTSLCSINTDCTATSHKTCVSGQCTVVSGAGSDLCARSTDCALSSHTECVSGQCATVTGPGANQCSCPPGQSCSACRGIIGGGGIECIPGVPSGETCNKNDPSSNCYDYPTLDGCDTTCPKPGMPNCGFGIYQQNTQNAL